jgi:hypothetical protein
VPYCTRSSLPSGRLRWVKPRWSNVIDQIATENIDQVDIEDLIAEAEQDDMETGWEGAAIPNLLHTALT